MKVKPRKGLTVRDAQGHPIPPKGKEVPNNEFYNRLVNDGDLTKVVKTATTEREGA